MLRYTVFHRIGETKLGMSRNYFGSDHRRFAYFIRMVCDHIYKKKYHKVSGDSIRMWLPHISIFFHAIWERLTNGETLEQSCISLSTIRLNISFEGFQLFGFLDDTGFRTNAPGLERRITYGFNGDTQRSFYSDYFAGRGMKAQVITLPNDMYGAVYLGALRVSDTGLLNMSGLDAYLYQLFNEQHRKLPGTLNQLPAVYGAMIFPQLAVVVACYSMPNQNQGQINRCLVSVRQSIEYMFTIHTNTFSLFNMHQRSYLLIHGVECYTIMFNSFFLLNYSMCMNESPNNFNVQPPRIEEYLPLDERVNSAPIVVNEYLGEVYNYYV